MRILWQSTSPECSTGYGIVTRELVRRFKKAGHFVRVATKHGYTDWKKWEGIEIFEGTNLKLLRDMIKEENFDYIFTLWDIWKLPPQAFPKEKWVAYVPIDTEWISDLLASRVADTGMQIAMSKHGLRELKARDFFKAFYAPCGVDVDTFRPKPEGREAFRHDFGWTDKNFIIGSVGLNYGDDRKGFIPLMRAFKSFHYDHPEARLYIHTHWEGKYRGTVNYQKIATKLGIDKYIAVPHQSSNDTGRINKEWLVDVYNGFDVFCLPSRGEGFGLPIIEAQACGIPVVVSDTTTGFELCKTGWLINVNSDDLQWSPNGTFRYECVASEVLKQLEGAYNFWKTKGWDEIKKEARENILEYSWKSIWKKYWIPIIKEMEARLG